MDTTLSINNIDLVKLPINDDIINYILCIYSCKKNLNKSNDLFKIINGKINNTHCFIIYGDPSISENYIIQDNYLILKVEDNYESLTFKTLHMIETIIELYPNIIGLFKIDDDVILNIERFDKLLKFDLSPIDYMGTKNTIKKKIYTLNHNNKVDNNRFNKKHLMPRCTFCIGPIYYLNNKAIKFFADKTKKKVLNLYEDITIGYNLMINKFNICDFRLYTDQYCDFVTYDKIIGYHNTQYKIYITLNEDNLSQNLFLIASAYGLSMTVYKSKKVICVSDKPVAYINRKFPSIFYDIPQNIFANVTQKYPNFENINEPIILTGQFTDDTYFKDYKIHILHLFRFNEEIKNELINKYRIEECCPNSYFIHISTNMGTNAERYYVNNINYVYQMNPRAKFYVITKPIIGIPSYINRVIKNSTIIIESDEIKILYSMMLCYGGGISSNDPISWWGSYLNSNPKKITIYENFIY